MCACVYCIFSATVTEKLGRHKLLLKKRKSQFAAGRASGESTSTSSEESVGDDSRTEVNRSELFLGGNGHSRSGSDPTSGGGGSGGVPSAVSGGVVELQPIRIRQSSVGGRLAGSGPSGDTGATGGKRLERLPSGSRGPSGLNPAAGGSRRFADLLKNRKEEQPATPSQETEEPLTTHSQERKTDVAKIFQTPRRGAQGKLKS